jgi:WD40 repeat protein
VDLLTIDSGVSTFKYTAFGLDSVAYIDPQKIVAGRTQSGALNTALLQINPITGETVPVPDSSIVVFDLGYDRTSQVLYTLDIENAANGGTQTVLKAHELGTLDRGTTLLSFPGEDHSAGFAVDASTNSIFTSLGFKGVKQIMSATGDTISLERTDHIPRKLLLHGNWIISLNADSTITVWNRTTGKRVFDLYLFKDLSWAVISSSGRFMSSPGARKYIKVFDGMKPSSSSLQSLQYRF